MTIEKSHQEKIDRVAQVAAEHAERVDREASFPQAAVDAFRESGLGGLLSATDVGGLGLGLGEAAHVVESLARACASSAMVVCMHYAAAIVLEKTGDLATKQQIASGKHLSTLAFSEQGSRGQFWAPVSSAEPGPTGVRLNAHKSWVTAAHHADSYVWSSKPLAAAGASTLWLVPRSLAGLRVAQGFDGLGLRGNDSCAVVAEAAELPKSAMLGADGEGMKLMLEVVLPFFNVMNASCSLGIMEAACARTVAHVTATRFTHDGSNVADLATVRAFVARMRIKTDLLRGLHQDTLAALGAGRADAVLRVLEIKAAAGEAATEVTDWAMRVCGGAAYRKDVGVERQFRDARASLVMAPTTDVLFEFIGKAVCNMPLFG